MNLKDVLLYGFVTFLEKTMFFHMFSNGLWFSETTLPEIFLKKKEKEYYLLTRSVFCTYLLQIIHAFPSIYLVFI